MTETRRKALYVYVVVMVIGYRFLIAYWLHRDPSEFLFGVIGGVLFFLFYLVPLGLLQGKITAADRAVSVERWSTLTMEYSDVIGCYGLFLLPFQTEILVTKRPFPLNIIIAGDEIVGRRRSLFQRGRLASSVMNLKASYDQR
jgi:hypothetical protein